MKPKLKNALRGAAFWQRTFDDIVGAYWREDQDPCHLLVIQCVSLANGEAMEAVMNVEEKPDEGKVIHFMGFECLDAANLELANARKQHLIKERLEREFPPRELASITDEQAHGPWKECKDSINANAAHIQLCHSESTFSTPMCTASITLCFLPCCTVITVLLVFPCTLSLPLFYSLCTVSFVPSTMFGPPCSHVIATVLCIAIPTVLYCVS